MQSHYVTTNGIQLHYLDSGTDLPPLLLMHGLTANAHAFDGLIKAGLTEKHRLISVSLRGRGLSEKPQQGYDIPTHAKDIIGLLDALQLDKVIMGGHSFGALLTFYLASHYPERATRLILMDAAMRMHPDTKELLKPAMGRLDQTFDSWEHYLEKIKQAPYLQHYWEDTMLSYFEADVEKLSNGNVIPRPRLTNMAEAVNEVLSEDWLTYLQKIHHSSILINATGPYGLAEAPPLLPEELAKETVDLLKDCTYQKVWGNHQTMLYGQGAEEIVATIHKFVQS
ncbi:MAG: alpha/beta hydrolase [Bacteroidota bacterium]